MHEHTPRHTAPAPSASDRSFGLVFAAFFAIVGLLPLLNGLGMRLWAILLSSVFLLLAFAAPNFLAPANRIWMKFGALLHTIVSPVALGVLFFCVVTPTGLVMRLLGKDPLRLRFDPSAKSYWIERNPPGPDAESLNHQF